MKRNNFIDYAKGILITLVTIGHAIQYAVYQDGDFWTDPVFKSIYMFHMPLFMGISGYLAYSGIQKSTFTKFTLIKLKAYIIPILAWAIIFETVCFLIRSKTTLPALPILIIKDFFGSGLWFLWALFGCLILTAMVKSMGRFFWILYGTSSVLVLLLPEKGNIVMLKFMYPFFQAGFIVATIGGWKLDRIKSNIILLDAIIITAICYALWSKDSYIYTSGMVLTGVNASNIILRFLAGFSASIVAVFVFIKLHDITPKNLGSKIEALGRDSIYIYILQGYVFLAISRLAAKLYAPISNMALGSMFGVTLGVVVALFCWMIGRILTKNDIVAEILFGKPQKRIQEPRP